MDIGTFLNAAMLGSCIGVCGASINALFQRRFETRKLYAELFIRPKVEALRFLLATVVACQLDFLAIPHKPGATRMWDSSAERQTVYESKRKLFEELTKTILAAAIYLEIKDQSILFKFRDAFYDRQIAGHFNPDYESTLAAGQADPYLDLYGQVEARLRTLLYPQAILSSLLSETER